MICRLRLQFHVNSQPLVLEVVGMPSVLLQAAYEAGALGVSVMVLR